MKNNHLEFTNRPETPFAHLGWLEASLVLAALTLLMFGDVLFFNTGQVLSKAGHDLFRGELSGCDFLFRQMRMGAAAIWNPYVFGGTPCLSTPLYLPLASFLFFSLPLAANISIALHVFLSGFFMYLWTKFRGLHPLACLAAAITVMFSAPFFLHIYAGHLINLCAMAWVPLIFLSLDAVLERPSVLRVLVGILAVSMQILTGQFQYVYYTAIACSMYAGISLLTAKSRGKSVLAMLFIVIGSLAICSFQLFNSILATGESIRTAGVSFAFSSMFSFPPENALTFLAPFFFGDMNYLPYWGRCYLWEMSAFIGVTGFLAAVYGALYGLDVNRRVFTVLVILLFILALGVHTPAFQLLYYWLPGFSKFRGSSKFIFPACLFLAMLEGVGLDKLIRHGQKDGKFILGAVFAGAVLLLAACLFFAEPNLLPRILVAVEATKEIYLAHAVYTDINFLKYARQVAIASLSLAGFLCLFTAFLLYSGRCSDKMIYLIIAVAVVEVFTFARLNRPTFNINEMLLDSFKKYHAAHPGDYRVFNQINHNMAMSTGTADIWGYGPLASQRYIQFMAFTQGKNQDDADTYLQINNYHRLFSMLRLRYIITRNETGLVVAETKDYMPRLNLVPNWTVLPSRNAIFREMGKESFDPRRQVILEREPGILPAASGAKGSTTLIESGTNHLLIKVNTPAPAMLLITDNYSKGWHAMPEPGSRQKVYEILPANYTLMAVPLQAGDHHLRLEYRPEFSVIGQWISGTALFICLILIFLSLGKSGILKTVPGTRQ